MNQAGDSRSEQRLRRYGFGVSAALHALGVFSVVLTGPMGIYFGWNTASATKPAIVLVARADWDRPPTEPVEVIVKPSEDAPLDGEAVASRVNDAIADAQRLAPDDQLQRLEQLTEKLNRVATEKSVDELTGKFQKWLGTKPRATRPKDEPVTGEFDFKTAQLHDVVRDPPEGEISCYQVVLVDAEGRQFATQLTSAEGEQLFKTWQLIKANPLLERVYRGVVMGLMDELLQKKQ